MLDVLLSVATLTGVGRTDQRWSLAGTTLTPVSDAGCRALTSTRNKCVSLSFPLVPAAHLDHSGQSFEQLNPRAVAVVVDPIQSVKGKVVIDAFRSINPQQVMMGIEPRQSTSNVGHLQQPSIQVRVDALRGLGGRRQTNPFPPQALIHGLNRHYYSIAIAYRKTDLEQSMLLNLHKKDWTEGLKLRDWQAMKKENEESIKVRCSSKRSVSRSSSMQS